MLRNRTDIPSYSIWWYININLNLVPGKHHWNLVGKLRSEGLSAPCTWTWCHDLALNLGRCYELYCFFYGKHMKHGSIIHFLGRVCKLPSSHFTMDPSCQRYTGRQSSQEGSGSQCSANEPEVRLFHGRCVWFLCGRVHVFFSWKPVFQSLMLGRWRCLWKFLFNSIIDSGMLRSDYNSLQGDWHE